MTLTRFDDADAFLAAAGPLVVHDAARTVWLRAWVESLKAAPQAERSFMAIWVRDATTGVGCQRGELPLVIGDSSQEAAVAFADALADEHPALSGVVGTLPACEAFVQRWQRRTGRTHALRFHMRNHVLDRLIAPAIVPGRVRVADASDREWLLEMHNAFAAETGVAWTSRSAERLVDERLAKASFRIWNDGVDVAFAGFAPAGRDAARVAPVYTLPRCRRRGYGGALVGAICADLLASGRRVYLVTDVSNPTSNQLYARLGFRPLDDFREFGLLELR